MLAILVLTELQPTASFDRFKRKRCTGHRNDGQRAYRLDKDVLREVLELLRHGGREEEGLPLLLEVVHDLLHLVFHFDPIRIHLRMTARARVEGWIRQECSGVRCNYRLAEELHLVALSRRGGAEKKKQYIPPYKSGTWAVLQ